MIPERKIRNIIDSNIDNDHNNKTTGLPSAGLSADWFPKNSSYIMAIALSFSAILAKLRTSPCKAKLALTGRLNPILGGLWNYVTGRGGAIMARMDSSHPEAVSRHPKAQK